MLANLFMAVFSDGGILANLFMAVFSDGGILAY